MKRLKLKGNGLYWQPFQGRRILLRWTLLLPFLLACLLLLSATLIIWAQQSPVHQQLLSSGPQARAVAWDLLGQSVKSEVDELTSTTEPPADTELDTIDLFVSGEDLAEIVAQKRDFEDDRVRYRAFFRINGEPFQEVDVMGRGYSAWHHQPDKPSLRLRFSKKEGSLGMRWVDLERPEDPLAVANWLPDQIADSLGLVNGKLERVRLYINREYKGVYLWTLRAGDKLALENGRLPGTFFRGEDLAVETLWARPESWSVEGETTPELKAWFEEFLALVNDRQAHPQNRHLLEGYLDTKAFAKFLALGIFTGSSHADNNHNQLFYLSSCEGKLDPALRDFNSLGILQHSRAHPNIISSNLAGFAYWDPRFVYERDKVLYQLVGDKHWSQLLEDSYQKLRSSLSADPSLLQLHNAVPYQLGWQNFPESLHGRITGREVPVSNLLEAHRKNLQWLDERRDFLSAYLQDAKVSLQSGEQGLQAVVWGNVAVRARGPGGDLLLFPGLDFAGIDTSMELPQQYSVAAPLVYTLSGAAGEWKFENAVTGAPLKAGSEFPPPPQRPVSLAVPAQPVAPEPETVTVGPGTVVISKDLRLPETTTLVVRPGTTIKIKPDVSVLCYGPVKMEGTADQPISVGPDGDQPWGTFNVLGAGSAGSIFRHVRMTGGSTARRGALHLKGMLNVYGCPSVTLQQSEFGLNKVGDDAVNLALSAVRVEDCKFFETPWDGLDMDGCRGLVVDSRFIATGNDGLDIMESDLEVSSSLFQGCGDKGISIGEECRTAIDDCEFVECQTGLELKDGSRTLVNRSEFLKCAMGLRAYRKKWMFRDGGLGELRECRFTECQTDLEVDKHSRLWVNDTDARLGSNDPRVEKIGFLRLGKGPSVKLPEIENH